MSDQKNLYRTSLEGMYDHLHDDVPNQVIPEGIPDARLAWLADDEGDYESFYDAIIERWRSSPCDDGVRFAHDRPVSYRTAPARIDATQEKANQRGRRTLWDIITTPLHRGSGR